MILNYLRSMLFHSSQLHNKPMVNQFILILMGSMVLLGFYIIPTRWPQLPYLPFEWAGIVIIAFCFGKRALISTILFQVCMISFFLLSTKIDPANSSALKANQWQWLLGLNLGQWLGEWLSAWVVGNIAQYWRETEKPWWTFLVSILGMGIIQGANALWMKAFPIHDAADTWKITLPGVLILSSGILMLVQIILRIKKGRNQFYQ
mgnify:CR=1 FL=1